MKKYETSRQLADLEEKRRLLMRHINQWRTIQLTYIPAAGPMVAAITSEFLSAMQSDKENSLATEHIPLFLPSSLLSTIHSTSSFSIA